MPTPLMEKDPDGVADYVFDWTDDLDSGDTITDATVTVATGLTLDSSSFTDSLVTAWLSGGTNRVSYRVTCHVVTAGGREFNKSCVVVVREA